jgi:hypothetical protein
VPDDEHESRGGPGANRTLIVLAIIIATTAVAITAIVVVGGHSSTTNSTSTKSTVRSTGTRPTVATTTTTTPPTTVQPTTTTATSVQDPTTALLGVLKQSFASEPAAAFNVKLDPNSPTWAFWSVYDPYLGSAYGFAQSSGGTWQIVAGPGSSGVGCPGGPQVVPPEIMSDLGVGCPP